MDGTAEDIPLEDASVDLVTVAQAFHWFDGPAALAEIHRVLRPGGRLALLWNRRVEDAPITARICSISFIARLPEAERADLLSRARDLTAAGPVTVPYRTEVQVAARL